MAKYDLQPFSMLIGHADITLPARPEANTGGLLFSTSQTEEAIRITEVLTNNAITLIINGSMVLATGGNIDLVAKVVAVSPGDSQIIDAKAYGPDNASGAIAVPGTAGWPFASDISIPLANFDGGVLGDYLKIMIFRDHDSGDDTASGDFLMRKAFLSW